MSISVSLRSRVNPNLTEPRATLPMGRPTHSCVCRAPGLSAWRAPGLAPKTQSTLLPQLPTHITVEYTHASGSRRKPPSGGQAVATALHTGHTCWGLCALPVPCCGSSNRRGSYYRTSTRSVAQQEDGPTHRAYAQAHRGRQLCALSFAKAGSPLRQLRVADCCGRADLAVARMCPSYRWRQTNQAPSLPACHSTTKSAAFFGKPVYPNNIQVACSCKGSSTVAAAGHSVGDTPDATTGAQWRTSEEQTEILL